MSTVVHMSKEELREMIEEAVEQKLVELLGDPDADLPLRKAIKERLLRQQRLVAGGDRGESLEDVARSFW